MKKILLAIFVLLFSLQISFADEGMWLLTLLNKNYEQMKAEGFKLTPEDIYNLNESSVKDAIVIFGGFCTGELVSEQGLIFTNHHCGFGSIQSHSTVEHDYLTDGFWAASFEDELPNPGLFVKFLIRMDDVSADVLKGVSDDMTETQRDEKIKKNIEKIEKKLSKQYSEKNGYDVDIQSFFENNQYFSIIYLKYDDVRLVGTPPSSIGKFGGDTDNWMWTRHTGDFSIFRVYADKDGNPAKYSTKNVPLKPKHVLPVSIRGIQEGDYAMILGFPGRTNRYSTTYGIEEVMNITNYNREIIRGERQNVLLKDMRADQEVYIKYASKYARSSNYWKYSIGQNQGLKKLKVIDKKKNLENKFSKWISADETRKAKYSEVLPTFKEVYSERKDNVYSELYIRECFVSGTEYISFAHAANDLFDLLKAGKTGADLVDAIANLRGSSEVFFKDYNAPTDKKVALVMMKLFTEKVDMKYYPSFISNAKKEFSSFDDYIANIFKVSIFVNKAKFDDFLLNPTLEKLQNDPAFVASQSVFEKRSELRDNLKYGNEKLKRAKRLWMAGLMEMQPEIFFYPDANFTMRLTYGTIGGYSPKDGVEYKYYTTLKGYMEKEDEENPEFTVPEKLKKLYETKDFGQYANADGEMPVCFLSNNDITGGNSGSPVLNANGELIGLAFDGNWEAMSGDIAFEPELQRTISVDVRYVLFIIDKYGEATRLIDELNIVR
ncbi:MAG: S46 family peptidase [Bacteroidales bacterium]|nr:S46 family peptidase [Bacteroidales bacterium]